ncbi:MAG: PilZ domain-containing protein [Pseudomonadota bacterium]
MLSFLKNISELDKVPHRENRTSTRFDCSIPAQIQTDQKDTFNISIKNISFTGMRIQMSDVCQVPEQFFVHSEHFKHPIEVRKKWGYSKIMGVVFVNLASNHLEK